MTAPAVTLTGAIQTALAAMTSPPYSFAPLSVLVFDHLKRSLEPPYIEIFIEAEPEEESEYVDAIDVGLDVGLDVVLIPPAHGDAARLEDVISQASIDVRNVLEAVTWWETHGVHLRSMVPAPFHADDIDEAATGFGLSVRFDYRVSRTNRETILGV